MKRFIPFLIILIMAAFAIQFTGCASSKPKGENSQTSDEQDLGEIERLLGISSEDSVKKKQPQEGDDLLTLLKADEDKGTTPTAGAEEISTDPRFIQMQTQVNDLEDQLIEKNRTIADLKAQLMMKEEELKSYQGRQKSSIPDQSPAPPTSSKTDYQPTYQPPVQSNKYSSSKSEFEQEYDQALELFHNRQYSKAMDAFEALLAKNRNHSLSDNAQYWIGECNYAMGNYRAAILAFEKVFSFTQSNKNDYAQYKLGQCYFKLGEKDRAREEFQNLIDNYSNSMLIEQAHDYLAKLEGQ